MAAAVRAYAPGEAGTAVSEGSAVGDPVAKVAASDGDPVVETPGGQTNLKAGPAGVRAPRQWARSPVRPEGRAGLFVSVALAQPFAEVTDVVPSVVVPELVEIVQLAGRQRLDVGAEELLQQAHHLHGPLDRR